MKLRFNFSLLTKVQIFFSLILLVFCIISFSSLNSQLNLSKKEILGYRKFFENYQREKDSPPELPSFSNVLLPQKLQNIPFAETENIVLKTKKITIRTILAPYSPSLIKQGDGYLMFFCYDILQRSLLSSYIGCVELDKNFDQTDKEFVKIDTFNDSSADPRVFLVGNESYLLYTKRESRSGPNLTFVTMNIAGIDVKNYKLTFTTELDLNFRSVEKNWVPFEYLTPQGKPEIFFQYNLNPHKILELPDPKVNCLAHPVFSKYDIFQPIHWEQKSTGWGSLQGGTPALKIGNQYLAFFHSSFVDKENATWSLMGAYTFEQSPPFRITSLSPYPILFSGIYNSMNLSITDIEKHTISPTGFVVEKEGEKEFIHLCCGENDSAIKVITLDKKNLIKHLRKI